MTGRARLGSAAAISAHRGGSEIAPAGTYEAYRSALRTGAEYIELDIRRTADAQLVVHHDASVGDGKALADLSYATLCETARYEVPRVTEVLALIAGHAMGHLDIKESGDEELIVEQAQAALGPGNFVVTTQADASVAAIKRRFPDAHVALSLDRCLGRGFCRAPWLARPRARSPYPVRRIRACGADWAAINQRLALFGVLRQCHRHAIKTMVWTVNSEVMMLRWLADPRVDVVVTDRPRRAIELRRRLLRTKAASRGAPEGRSQ